MADGDYTHTFEAEPGTIVEYYVEGEPPNSVLFLKRYGFGILFGPLENEEEAQGVMDERGWVLYVEPEPEEPVEPAIEEKPDDG